MRGTFERIEVSSNNRTPKNRSEKKPKKTLFFVIAKHRFPDKTAEEIAALTGDAPSTIYDWMAGRSEAPFRVYIELLR